MLDQIGDPSAYDFGSLPDPSPSQFFTDFPTFDCALLEDFSVTSSQLELSQVAALFRAQAGFAHFDDVAGFSINIFSSLPHAAASLVGDVANLFLTTGSGATVTEVDDLGGTYEFGLVELDVNIALPSAGTYWVGVSPVASSAVAGQFLVQTSNVALPAPANGQFANPAQGFGGDPVTDTGNHYAYSVTAVPEPRVPLLLALMLGGWAIGRNRRKDRGAGAAR